MKQQLVSRAHHLLSIQLCNQRLGRKDESINRFTGRAPDFSLVHFATSSKVRPGDYVQLVIDHAAPHHLVSDREPISIRKSAAGDLYEQGSKTSIPLVLSTRPE